MKPQKKPLNPLVFSWVLPALLPALALSVLYWMLGDSILVDLLDTLLPFSGAPTTGSILASCFIILAPTLTAFLTNLAFPFAIKIHKAIIAALPTFLVFTVIFSIIPSLTFKITQLEEIRVYFCFCGFLPLIGALVTASTALGGWLGAHLMDGSNKHRTNRGIAIVVKERAFESGCIQLIFKPVCQFG